MDINTIRFVAAYNNKMEDDGLPNRITSIRSKKNYICLIDNFGSTFGVINKTTGILSRSYSGGRNIKKFLSFVYEEYPLTTDLEIKEAIKNL